MDFFCVAIPRRIIDAIGLLDEEFGRGYFEDLDYSLRVKKAGYRLAITETCFIFHQGSSSFKQIPLEIKVLMKKNRQLVKSKHGKQVRLQHKRTANLSVLKQYADLLSAVNTVPPLCIQNRLQLARQDVPRSHIKRWAYEFRLRRISNRLARY